MVNDVTSDMYDQYHWQKTVLGHDFNMSRHARNYESSSFVTLFRSWLGTHEEAQVMLGSVLIVVALWWLVRAVLSLVIHLVCPLLVVLLAVEIIDLVCPLLVVLLAVICVPQLRGPLLGQNYPALANLLHNILIRLADNIKTN